MDERVSIIEKVDHSERVVICRRLDGSLVESQFPLKR